MRTRLQPRPLTAEQAQLVERWLPLVHRIVGRLNYRPRSGSFDNDDCFGVGVLGLITAAQRYDPARGVPFGAWAAIKIRGAILDALRLLSTSGSRRHSPESYSLEANALLALRLGGGDFAGDLCDALSLAPYLAALRPREAEILRLYYWQDWSIQRIAQAQGVSACRISQIRKTAEKKLRRQFEAGYAA